MHVLVVDDDPTICRMAKAMLERREPGTTVDTAATLGDARGMALERGYDAIVLDLGLPDSSGINTLEAMLDIAPDTPIIVLSGTSDASTIQGALTAGAEDFIVKQREGTESLAVRVRNAIVRRGRNAPVEEGHHIHDRDHLVRQFLNEANHELRTPLTSIGVAQNLLRRGDLDASGRERLARNLQRLRETIEDFLGVLSNPVLHEVPLDDLLGRHLLLHGEPLQVIGNRQALERAFRALRRVIGSEARVELQEFPGDRIRIRLRFQCVRHPEVEHPVLMALVRQHLEQTMGSLTVRGDTDCQVDVMLSRSLRTTTRPAAAEAL